jgi:hypothetical protein
MISNATRQTRWRPVLILLSLAGIALPVRAADSTTAPAPKPAASPAVSGSGAATSVSGAMPAASPSGKLPGNDPTLFANSIPTNTGPALSGAAPDAASTSFAVNLLKRLVKRGVLTQEDADNLTKQAQEDAATARAQSQADAAAASQAVVSQVAEKAAQMTPPPPTDDEVRVPYVPEVVKQEMRDEIKADVMKQARAENWANPRAIPEWVPRFRFTGDVRTRYEGDFFPNTNDNTGAYPNFNSINTGAPFDVAGTNFSPQYNVDQDRERFRLRARIGAEVDLQGGFTAGIRLGTGQDDSPVTENQTLGLANGGQGGNFSRYAIWLDRAFLKYEVGGDPDKDFSIAVGRMDNPFFSTSMIWARDLGFDGITAQGRYKIATGLTPFLTLGAYPVFNTDFNFASNQPAKFQSEDKYLFAGQLGADWKINKDVSAKMAGALYYFENVQGHLSSPFTPLSATDQGNTDDSRPAFAQNGNTYFPIRDIVPTAQNNFGTIDQFQYYGLATPFHELDFTGQLNYDRFAPIRVSLIGEFTKNLAFSYDKINAVAVNNRSATTTSGALGNFDGGDTAWIVTFKVGHAALEKFGDWSFDIGYRYVESDAIVDGFADADFGAPLTGTNLKGYTVGGDFALGPRVRLGLHWMSADSIAGPPYKNDIVQFDIFGNF